MKYKRLAILSDCVHIINANGQVMTENHIYRKQIEMLASLFEQTIIFCPFTPQSVDKVASVYTNRSIQFYPLKNVGGTTLKAKLNLIRVIPSWFKAFKKANDFADIIYQRFPNNLNIPGFFYFRKTKRFATYTGTWKNFKGESLTYRLQKWLLKKYFKGFVGIYNNEENGASNFFNTFSPSYTINEWHDESENVSLKIRSFTAKRDFLPIFVTVGSLVPHKNQQYILHTFKLLNEQHFDFTLYVVGDGFLKNSYTRFISENNLKDKIVLTGKMTDVDLRRLYRKAHFLIQAPYSEGFGKVPIEGFFHGVIPFLSNTAMAGEMTGNDKERGFVFRINKPYILAKFILKTISKKRDFPYMIKNAREYARLQTLENWAEIYKQKIQNYFE